jgi:hypothetical protein
MIVVFSSTSLYGICPLSLDSFIIIDHIKEQASHIYSIFGLGIEYPNHSFREIQLVKVSILLVLPFVYFHRWSPDHLV